MIPLASQGFALIGGWLVWELFSQVVSHPIDADTGEPIRPPLSVLDYLFYNPGVLRGESE